MLIFSKQHSDVPKTAAMEDSVITQNRVGHTLPKILGTRKLSAWWVQPFLPPDNKRIFKSTSQQRFTRIKGNMKEFLSYLK